MSFDRLRPTSLAAASVNWLLVILLILMAALLWQGRGGGGRNGPSSLYNPDAPVPPIVARGDLAEDEKATIALFKKASPSVVHITTLKVVRDLNMDVFGIPQGSGTGFVWDDQGYIITNFHVIESADAAKVTLSDRSEWDGRKVGIAPDKDLVVLKIDAPAEQLRPLDLGTSANLQVGQKVFAIGNPFGLDQTLTTGVISQLGREILSLTNRPIQGVIQTDAAINPGNSGGPLLDSAGLLIGVNTSIVSPSGTNAGIGFAVPVDTVRWIVPQIIRHGKVERVGIGVAILDDQIARRLGIVGGVVVQRVNEGSPAAVAGIRPIYRDEKGNPRIGDVIIAIAGKPVRNSIDLFRILDQSRAGDTLVVTVNREGKEINLNVTVAVLE